MGVRGRIKLFRDSGIGFVGVVDGLNVTIPGNLGRSDAETGFGIFINFFSWCFRPLAFVCERINTL